MNPKSPISGSHLNGSASSGEEMRDEQNDCDHVECDKSQQPQHEQQMDRSERHEQNSGDSSEHDVQKLARTLSLGQSRSRTENTKGGVTGQTINRAGLLPVTLQRTYTYAKGESIRTSSPSVDGNWGIAENQATCPHAMMRSLNPFAHTHPALTDLRNQDVAAYLISWLSVPLMVPAGGIEPSACVDKTQVIHSM
jgi:hypothetical protein